MTAIATFLDLVRSGVERSRTAAPGSRTQEIFRALCNARIYSLEASAFEALAAEPWSDSTLALPALPFRNVFVAYDSPIRLSDDAAARRRSLPTVDSGRQFGQQLWTVGHLFFTAVDGHVSVYEFTSDESAERWAVPILLPDVNWTLPGLDSSRIRKLAGLLGNKFYGSESMPTSTERYSWNRLARKQRIAPARPYYEIRIGPSIPIPATSSRDISTPRKPISYSHRFDVSAHDRLLVQRGMRPCPPRQALDLFDRGYAFYSENQPPERWQAWMRIRGIAPKLDCEWIAFRVVRISEHVKGPERRRYLPGIRFLEAS